METDTLRLNHSSYDVKALQEELELLNSELSEANEQRAQAAEYGLVLLEEKQALQSQHQELSGLYETTKKELENSTDALKHVQADYEKRLKDVEAQREQLLEEMETRENTLINDVDRGEEKVRQLERKLKQSATENDCISEQNSYLTKELDRCKREVENFRDENRTLKLNSNLLSQETEDLRDNIKQLEQKIEILSKLEEDCHRLQEENSTLMKDSRVLQGQFESIVLENQELECQAQEAMQALSDEKECRSMLEIKLKEDSRFSPTGTHWAEESKEHLGNHLEDEPKLGLASMEDEVARSTPSPSHCKENYAVKLHSTPYPATKNPPSLLHEIQDSFMGEADKEELDRLRGKLAELESLVDSNKNEKKMLEENLMASSVRETKQIKELEGIKEKFAKQFCEKDQKVEELNQRILIRDEQIEQYRSKLNTITAEKTSMEIEVDGLSSEIQRLKAVSGLEIEKFQRESAQEQAKSTELSSQISILEEQVSDYKSSVQKLENIIYNSQTELATMTEDIRSMQKVVATLATDGRPSPTVTKFSGPSPTRTSASLNGGEHTPQGLTNGKMDEGEEEEAGYYSLKIRHRKTSVQVHSESNSLRAIASLHEQLKSVRSPLEQFTKVMLERSLIQSTKHAPPPSSSSPDPLGANRKNTLDLEASISKWKSKFMHKTEELNNLRSIMKARATTAEVATSSLRSKLEGQARAYQTELTKLKYQIKILKKEKDEHLSLRTMYAKRCDEYIDEITRLKKEAECVQQEYDGLYVSLEKTIKRKLELSTELEEYKMEQERRVLIPKLLESSRV